MNITAKLDRVNKITSTIMLVYQQKWPLKIKKTEYYHSTKKISLNQ